MFLLGRKRHRKEWGSHHSTCVLITGPLQLLSSKVMLVNRLVIVIISGLNCIICFMIVSSEGAIRIAVQS